jgi:hypothetical protein
MTPTPITMPQVITWSGQVFSMSLGTLDGFTVTLGAIVVVVLVLSVVLMVYSRIAKRK